jgi:hypothetical protein
MTRPSILLSALSFAAFKLELSMTGMTVPTGILSLGATGKSSSTIAKVIEFMARTPQLHRKPCEFQWSPVSCSRECFLDGRPKVSSAPRQSGYWSIAASQSSRRMPNQSAPLLGRNTLKSPQVAQLKELQLTHPVECCQPFCVDRPSSPSVRALNIGLSILGHTSPHVDALASCQRCRSLIFCFVAKAQLV